MENTNFLKDNILIGSSVTGDAININSPDWKSIIAELSDIKSQLSKEYREADSLQEQVKKCSKEDRKKLLPLLGDFANKFGYPVLSKLVAEYVLGKMQ